ncbi:MAG: hypothetical protein FWE96_07780, partial [Coriobacteriia bacterium]|nr:hypothetical protein [Coriobacteriia bacterium]
MEQRDGAGTGGQGWNRGTGLEQRDGGSVPIWANAQIGTLTPSLCSNPVPLFQPRPSVPTLSPCSSPVSL